jgi:hypothetical protein
MVGRRAGTHADRGPGAVRLGLRRALYEVKTVVARYPTLAIPVARRRHGLPVDRRTDIVIEGFPRSGNTFAVQAFVLAQPAPPRVAGRVHAPAQVLAAVRWGIPAIVLLRAPEEAVPSFVVRHPHIPMRQALRGWVRFYRPLLPHRDRFVVATFDQVTTDFGRVVERVNERFGTRFVPFEHTEENVRRCWEAIDRDYRTRTEGREDEFLRTVARPSPAREELKRRLREEYEATVPARARAAARTLYEALAG